MPTPYDFHLKCALRNLKRLEKNLKQSRKSLDVSKLVDDLRGLFVYRGLTVFFVNHLNSHSFTSNSMKHNLLFLIGFLRVKLTYFYIRKFY